LQHSQVDDFKRLRISGGQYHRRSDSGSLRLKPAFGNHAPPVARSQTRKAVRGCWRDQVIADAPLMIEELGSYDCADQMDGLIWSTSTAAVAIEARDRVCAAALEFAAEDIAFTLHNPSLA